MKSVWMANFRGNVFHKTHEYAVLTHLKLIFWPVSPKGSNPLSSLFLIEQYLSLLPS